MSPILSLALRLRLADPAKKRVWINGNALLNFYDAAHGGIARDSGC
jgi:hypothetical protein